jgi:tRNA modification GTPase
MWSADELIVAPATAPGAGARAIVRLAGEALAGLLPKLVDAEAWPQPGVRPTVVRGTLAADGLGGEWGPLPVEVLVWPGPSGPIGGPLAEVQLPSSVPLVAAVVAESCRHGARLARGGEFTLRAFLAGRLDLVQAEAVLGVVDARTPAELSAALDRFGGGAGRSLESIRGEVLDLLADIEASIDFADETTPDAVPVGPEWTVIAARLDRCRLAIERVVSTLAGRDAVAVDLPRVVLVGRSNIGKSSLFNAVVGRDAVLVADEHGTTRDWVEARVTGGLGRDWLLIDLAGIDGASEDAGDGIVAEARARALTEITRADVVVSCRDADDSRPPPLVPATGASLAVITRIDRATRGADVATAIATSAVTGAGVAELRAAIDAVVAALPPTAAATLRMRVAAGAAAAAIAEARRGVAGAPEGPGDEAIVAGRLRAAAEALAEATGAAIGTDLLDRIFSRHCIGK